MVPLTEDAAAFAERFGVDVYTALQHDRDRCPIVSEPNPHAARAPAAGCAPASRCGIVDENDCEVRAGRGRRADRAHRPPWAMNHGYHKNPEATAEAWRNGWFHTGDAFRLDADGNFYFVDRHEGRDPPARREHLLVRGRGARSAPTRGAARRRPSPSRASSPRTRCWRSWRRRRARRIDPRRADRSSSSRACRTSWCRATSASSPSCRRRRRRRCRRPSLRREGVTADTWDREEGRTVVIKRGERLQ